MAAVESFLRLAWNNFAGITIVTIAVTILILFVAALAGCFDKYLLEESEAENIKTC